MAPTIRSGESLGCGDDYPSSYSDLLSSTRVTENSLVR